VPAAIKFKSKAPAYTNLIYYVVQIFAVNFLFRRFKKSLHSSALRNYFLKKYEQKRTRRLDYVIYQFGITPKLPFSSVNDALDAVVNRCNRVVVKLILVSQIKFDVDSIREFYIKFRKK
jgi:thiamine kinase-like enzyme